MEAAVKIFVETTYTLATITEVEIPDGANVADVSVKWGAIHVQLDDGNVVEAQETDADFGNIDWKRPESVVAFPADASGDFPDYDKVL